MRGFRSIGTLAVKRAVASSVCLLALLASSALAQAPLEGHSSPTPAVSVAEIDELMVIDGELEERVWRSSVPATDFVQQDPTEGEVASQRTEVRFAMDAEALYVGARMYDTLGAAGVRSRLTRRDQFAGGDRLDLIFDTFHDHSGRTMFWINPSGVKFDLGQASAYVDPSWDPVWTAATQVDSLGWTAELRIPLSQLRFPPDSVQSWGLQIWRHVERLNEVSMWSFWGKDESGGPPRFGHLTGIRAPNRLRAFEVMPYTTMSASYTTPTQPGSPFQSEQNYGMRMGADVKALLTSSVTLDATINPDFGQVEVDPAVVNLTAFETFLPEKRPFFVEGSGLFGFGSFSCYFCSNVNSMSLFYSRRIGRRPQGHLTFPTRFVQIPDNTGILGAAKITGRTSGGLQMGLLNAVTASEKAQVISADGESMTREVEPLTNYLVGRLRQTYRDGDLTIGAIGTSVLRRFDYDPISLILPARASALGFDWRAAFNEQTYSFEGNFAASQVAGDPAAILRLQNASARYFDRPDREHGSNGIFSDRIDPTMETLRGYGGYARIAKEAGGLRWETAVNFRSPGFEVNDMAFLTSADYVWMNVNLLQFWTQPTRFYRIMQLLIGGQQQYNFDGDRTGREGRVGFWIQFPNYWSFGAFVIRTAENLDDRLTRGGPVVLRPSRSYYRVNINSDARKKIVLGTNPSYIHDAEGAYSYQVNLNATIKPTSSVSLSVGPRFSRSGTASQYVARFADPSATHFHRQRIVFGSLVQHGLSMDTRASVTLTPTLTFELFAQPLIARGEYSDFNEFDVPRTLARTTFDENQIRPVEDDLGRVASYTLDPDRSESTANFSFDNPDFNLRSLRGNAVIRWEYRPGSTLFFVWQQNRSGRAPFGDLDVSRDLRGIIDQDSDDVFMVKASYWFGG